MTDNLESMCSIECSYVFHECEADGTPGGECRTYYNHCVEECTVTGPHQEAVAPV